MASLLNVGRGLVKLPYDTEIEYLECTGTQWIDTEIKCSDIKTLEINFIPYLTDSYSTLLGARPGNSDAGSLQVRIGSNNNANSKTIMIGKESGMYVNFSFSTKYNLYIDTKSKFFILNGVKTIPPSSEVTVSYKLPLFGLTVNGITAGGSNLKAKVFDLTINGKHFIPVKKGSDGYLWDGEKLYGNSGTGSFILGPDKTI